MIEDKSINFKNYMAADVTPLVLALNLLGKNLIGLELGVCQGTSLYTILNNCHIKKLYGVDSPAAILSNPTKNSFDNLNLFSTIFLI